MKSSVEKKRKQLRLLACLSVAIMILGFAGAVLTNGLLSSSDTEAYLSGHDPYTTGPCTSCNGTGKD